MPELERLFGRLFSAPRSDSDGPGASERPFSILVDQTLEPVEDGLIRLKGKVRYALSEHHEEPTADVELSISYRYVEDGGNGEEAMLGITGPSGFVQVSEAPHLFTGTLEMEYVQFTFVSEPYPADWTGRLKADAVISKIGEAVS